MQERADLPGLAEKFKQIVARISRLSCDGQGGRGPAGVHSLAFSQRENPDFNAAVKKIRIIAARFHGNSEICQINHALVNIKTVQIVLHYLTRRCRLAVAGFPVNLQQKIKGVEEDMAAADTGVKDCQLPGADRCRPVVAASGRTGAFGLDIKFQFFAQGAVRIAFQPAAPQRVVQQIAHDPVRCEDLGGGRNIRFFNLLHIETDDLIAAVCREILIKPADYLHLPTLAQIKIRLGNSVQQLPDQAVLIIVGETK